MLLSDVRRLSVCLVSVAYIGNDSRTDRPRKTRIGTHVAHVTRDSDTTFKVKRSKVKVTGLLWLAVQVTTYLYGRHQFLRHRPERVACLSIMNIHGARRAQRRRRMRVGWTGGGPQRVGRGHIVSPRAQLA